MRWLWLIGLLGSLLSPAAFAAQEEIKLEGSWNEPAANEKGACQGWQINPYFADGKASLKKPGNNSPQSLCLTNTSTEGKGFFIYSDQVIKAASGDVFQITLSTKGKGSWAIGFCCFSKGGTKIGWQVAEAGSGYIKQQEEKWEKHEFKVTIPVPKDPKHTITALRLLVSVPNGEIQFDNLKVSREKDGATTGPRGETAKAAAPAYVLGNAAAEIAFAGPEGGLACMSVAAKGDARFVQGGNANMPGLWRLNFRSPRPEDGEKYVMTNASPAARVVYAELPAEGGVKKAELTWEGVDLPQEKGAVDVKAGITLLPTGESQWRIQVSSRSKRLGLWSVEYPYLNQVSSAGTADVLFPAGMLGGSLQRQCQEGRYFVYPSGDMSVQFTAFMKEGAGLYVGAHDIEGRIKNLRITDGMDTVFEHYPAAMATCGEGFESTYPVSLVPFRGDWWTAAKIYRGWATRRLVGEGALLKNRPVPVNFKETAVVMLAWQNPLAVARIVSQAVGEFGSPVTAFWCEWNEHPFDTHYPQFFPARPNFTEGVNRMRSAGATAMPYVNMRLWMKDNAEYASEAAQRSLVRLYDGKTSDEYKGSVICPATDLAQQVWLNVNEQLVREGNVDAIYHDQVMAASPKFCFVPEHGHPMGASGAWTPAYRKLVSGVRAMARERQHALGLLSECFSDAFVNEFDGGLCCWWQPFQFQEAVPLVAAVYSGYTSLFPNADNASVQELDAYVMIQGRYFLWGMPCSVHQQEYENRPEPKACTDLKAAHQFVARAARMRHAAREFMIYGELLGELLPAGPLPEVTASWKLLRSKVIKDNPVTFPAVRASLWKSLSGDLGIALVNFSSAKQTFRYDMDPAKYGASSPSWKMEEVGPSDPAGALPAAPLTGEVDVPAYGTRFLAWRAVK